MSNADNGFLSRWARRKGQVRQGLPVEPGPDPTPARAALEPASEPGPVPVETAAETASVAPAPKVQPEVAPMPTLDDVAALGMDANYTRFVARGVDEDVKRAALKKLFAEPQFNVMDGLDIYIDDYGIPDPLPAGMLRKMNQAWELGLFGSEERPGEGVLDRGSEASAAQASDNHPPAANAQPRLNEAPPLSIEPLETDGGSPLNIQAPIHEDPDLQLQPNHDARRAGADESAEREPRRIDPGA